LLLLLVKLLLLRGTLLPEDCRHVFGSQASGY
jgi:hypothetical protein